MRCQERWKKLANDNTATSFSMAVVARSRFQDIRMQDGDTVVQTHHDLIEGFVPISSYDFTIRAGNDYDPG